jgi:hypothetical protein
MINDNLDIHLNSTVSLNSINYKSNQHRESFPYELDKIHPMMLQRDGDEGVGHDGDEYDDPGEAQLYGGDDGDDFPPPGRNFPGRFLPARKFSLSVCFPPRRGGGVYL